MAATNDKTTTDALVVLDSFTGSVDGEVRVFRQGEPIRATDPAVRKWPHLFGPQRFLHDPHVEQATKAPGERRA